LTLTKLSGWILILFAVAYFVISLSDFGPEYAAAGEIGAKAENYGLQTSETNLRFSMGWEFAIDIVIVGIIAIAGWWLTTQEVLQVAWIVMISVFLVFSIVVRSSPLLPLKVAKVSPGAAFYGAQIQLVILGDTQTRYVPISRKQTLWPVVTATPQGQQEDMVVLDLADPIGSQQLKSVSAPPFTIKGTVAGTCTLAEGTSLTTVPLIRVKAAQEGLPPAK
jgi:hypothetical protein